MWIQTNETCLSTCCCGGEEQGQACVVLLNQPGDYPLCRGQSASSIPEKWTDYTRGEIRARLVQIAALRLVTVAQRRRKPTLIVIRRLHHRFIWLWRVADWRLPAERLLHADHQVGMNRTGRITLGTTRLKKPRWRSCPPIPTGRLPSIFPRLISNMQITLSNETAYLRRQWGQTCPFFELGHWNIGGTLCKVNFSQSGWIKGIGNDLKGGSVHSLFCGI